MMSSATPEWATPPELFAEFNAEFDLDLDVCATPENAKLPRFYTKAEDGLKQPWDGRVWCNPPYGREISAWVARGRRAVETGEAEVAVFLVPARTDTAWWHDNVQGFAEVRFLRGRVRFGGAGPAPFPSALVVFRRPAA